VAGASLLTLIDDIASLLDDIALMTKVAAKKTAGVLGDDLALNAEQVSGIRAERELPVVWAVAKGSLRNKAILVPLALLISAVVPWLVTLLLMAGGAYLCFEGFEKVFHKLLPGHENLAEHHAARKPVPKQDLPAFEKQKIKGAIRTDFILSAEIIVIALGSVQGHSMLTQILVVSGIAVTMTFGVYGIVAGIVKLDDAGMLLLAGEPREGIIGPLRRGCGTLLLRVSPYLMKTLSVVGTAAMFTVGGGILFHRIPGGHHLLQTIEAGCHALPAGGPLLAMLAPLAVNMIVGLLVGAVVTAGMALVNKLVYARAA